MLDMSGQGCNFNSHARVGRDECSIALERMAAFHFNSHARVGRDAKDVELREESGISTHTPV